MNVLKKYLKGDNVIWAIIIGLSVFSLLVVYSSISTLAYKDPHGSAFYVFMRHSAFLLVGWGTILVFHTIPYKLYSKFSFILLVAGIVLLIFTLKFGVEINAARRWLRIPLLGLTFQTSDFAKLALVIYIAKVLSVNQERIREFSFVFKRIIIPTALTCALIMPEDFSTAAMLFLVTLIMMFIGRVKFLHISAIVFGGLALIALFVFIANEFNLFRVETILSRLKEFTGSDVESVQVVQSKIAVTSGGLFGRGPGNSVQRYFLPNPFSDYIYAIILEEYGIIGGFTVMFLYVILLFRAGVIVRKALRTFPAFLAMGLTLMLVVQAMTNMAVTADLFPVTGQPLPFISLGGTSMLFTGMALGIILSISRTIEKKEAEKKNEEVEQ